MASWLLDVLPHLLERVWALPGAGNVLENEGVGQQALWTLSSPQRESLAEGAPYPGLGGRGFPVLTIAIPSCCL